MPTRLTGLWGIEEWLLKHPCVDSPAPGPNTEVAPWKVPRHYVKETGALKEGKPGDAIFALSLCLTTTHQYLPERKPHGNHQGKTYSWFTKESENFHLKHNSLSFSFTKEEEWATSGFWAKSAMAALQSLGILVISLFHSAIFKMQLPFQGPKRLFQLLFSHEITFPWARKRKEEGERHRLPFEDPTRPEVIYTSFFPNSSWPGLSYIPCMAKRNSLS